MSFKGNQPSLHDDVRRFFDDPQSKVETAKPAVDGDHGRIETPSPQCGRNICQRRSKSAHSGAAPKMAHSLPSISWRPGGGTIGLCQRRKPPGAVAEGQRLQRPIVPPKSPGEIGAPRGKVCPCGECSLAMADAAE